MRLAVFCLARPTFDVDLAAETAQTAVTSLRAAGAEVLGDATLLLDAEAVTQRLEALKDQPLGGVLIVQATFCDAAMTAAIGATLPAPVAIWAFPEPRDGGRLRLNSFCGLSLAAHALGKIGRRCGWFHAPASEAPDLGALFGQAGTTPATRPAKRGGEAIPFASRIGLVGEHPDGFDTCGFDQNDLKERFNVDVERIELKEFFEAAESADTARIDRLRDQAAGRLEGLGDLDGAQVDKSLRCYAALRDLADSRRLDGFAVRCWPETFTEYGCAVCGAMATAVLWHCGLAPLDFCDPDVAPQATIHTNRRMPLLHEFPMKPGRVTVARISQAKSEMKMVIGRGEILKRPMSFTGTSGVIRFDCGAAAARRALIDGQLEHHVSLVYGDVKAGLEAAAAAAGLPVLDLDEAR